MSVHVLPHCGRSWTRRGRVLGPDRRSTLRVVGGFEEDARTRPPSPRARLGRSAATCRDRRARARGRASARRGTAARAPATARGARPRGRRAVRRPDRCARTAARRAGSAGAGGFVIVTGEPGIGKTRLVARFAAGVHARRRRGPLRARRRGERLALPSVRRGAAALRRAPPRHGLGRPRPARGRARVGIAAPRARGARASRRRRRGRPKPPSALRGCRPAAAACRSAQRGCCSSSRTSTGPTPRRRCCCGMSCAAARGRACSWSRRSTIVIRPEADPLADLRRDALDTVHARRHVAGRSRGAGAARAGRSGSRRRVGPATVRGDRRQPALHRGAAAQPGTATRASRVPAAVKHVIGRRLERLPRAALEMLTLAAVLGNDFSLTALEAVAPDREQDELIDVARGGGGGRSHRRGSPSRSTASHSRTRSCARRSTNARSRAAGCACTAGSPRRSSSRRCRCTRRSWRITTSRRERSAARTRRSCTGSRRGSRPRSTHAYEAAVEHYERVLSILPLVGRDDAGARCDLLLALGAARWQASEPDPRSTFAQALETGARARLARPAGARGARRRRPLLRAGGDRLRLRRPPRRGTRRCSGPTTARCACASWRASPRPSCSRSRRTALELADEALGIARRLAEPTMLAAALMGRHAALLHVEHACRAPADR